MHTSAEFCFIQKIKDKKSGIQPHSSLGIRERYHPVLLDTYWELKQEHPSQQQRVLIAAAMKAVNDTPDLEGTVPSVLVFG